MPQNFKVRLGDGTELVVDHDGLRTWSVDENAAVQTKKGWRSLKEVLAHLDRPPAPSDGVASIPLKRLDDDRPKNTPPPSTGELRSLSFKESADDEPQGDEYDDYVYEGPSVLGTAWMWMKRLVLVSGLAVGGYFAFIHWETWLPRAGEFGVAVLGQIQKHTGSTSAEPSAPAAPETREAVQAASQQLPHLSADAVQLVMSSSLSGTLEPAEIFRRAQEAADRGQGSLTPAEAQELRTLRSALLSALPAAERAGLQDYEKARAHRATLAFEDRAALGSYAHAARALPAASRDRLRTLLGKAIAAALRTGPGSDDIAGRALAAAS